MSDGTNNFELPQPKFPELDLPPSPVTGFDGVIRPAADNECFHPLPTASNVAPPPEGKKRIMIGVPILVWSHEFALSFLKFWTQICTQRDTLDFEVGYQFMYRMPVHMAEQRLVETAIFNKCTHILFMDDDIFDVTLDDLKKLVAADKDVIGGVMHASKFPFAMCVFRRYETTKKVIDMPSDNKMLRLYEVPCNCSKCGAGISHWDAKFCMLCGAPQDNIIQKADLIPFPFTLMKLDIFKKIKQPWFHCTTNYPTDSWFADRCIEAGIQQYAHMGVRLNHNGVNDISKPYLLQKCTEENKAKQSQNIVNITEDDMARHQFILHTKMTEAEERAKARLTLVTPGEWTVENTLSKQEVTNGSPQSIVT